MKIIISIKNLKRSPSINYSADVNVCVLKSKKFFINFKPGSSRDTRGLGLYWPLETKRESEKAIDECLNEVDGGTRVKGETTSPT